MRQSQLFTKTRKNAPKDEVAKNAQLLIRGGFIHKEMSGAYDLLPLGLRTLKNIMRVIREEMNAIGGQELELTSLQSPRAWQKSDRWSDESIDVWFKTALKDGGELGLAPTHEEPLTELMKEFIESYKDLPRYPYQFQKKFRNELRAKSGILRTREFVMKDMYSLSANEADFRAFYEKAAEAYLKIFKRVGLGDAVYRCFASGGSFSQFSDEFQAVCESGEDTVYLHKEKKIAVNKEVYDDEVLKQLGLAKSEMEEVRAIEVGNIFPLGTRFSDALGLLYKDEKGKALPVVMGSYGIGPARLMGTIVEVLSDDKGIVWPAGVAPFAAHLVCISGGNADVAKECDRVYELLRDHGVDVLYDDRDMSAGGKLGDADLIGIPVRLVVSEKTMSAGSVEMTMRQSGKTSLVPENDLLKRVGGVN